HRPAGAGPPAEPGDGVQNRDADAAASQAPSSKTTPSPDGSGTRNVSSARFGFGGRLIEAASGAYTSPTPPAKERTLGSACAPSIRAPLTWSGVSDGFSARRSDAIPETIGAESDVPESFV